jgi:hypothetical protein
MKTLQDLILELSPDLQEEVRDFAEFLLETKKPQKKGKLRLDWAGGLREFRGEFTSLGLQKKAMEWWGD